MKNSLFTVLLLTGSLSVFGQNPPIWTNRFATAGDNSDKYNSIAPLSGGFVTAGYSVKQGNYRDFLTVRTDGSGNILWSRTKNGVGNGNDVADFVAVDASNNIYVAGYTDGGNSQDDICLLKYDSNGNLLWTTIWNNTSSAQDDIPLDMALDASGNIIICGSTEPDALAGSSDYVTLKFAPNGGLLWQAIYARPGVAGGRDEADALVIDAAGDVYVTGRSFNGADDDIVTLKYNGASGALAWGTPAVYNSGTGDDRGADIALNSNGTSVYVTGRTDNGNDDDVRIVKYNSSGLFQWTRFYNGTLQQNDRGLFVYVDAAENIYVGGQTDADFSALTNYDFLLLKYSSLGAITWFRSDGFAALQNDIPTSMTVDAAGNLILTGYSDFDPGLTTSNYFYAVVWNNAGTKLSSSFNTGTLPNGNSEATEAVVNPTNGNIIVAGVFENTVSQKDGGLWSITTAGVTNWSRSHNFFGDFTSAFEAVTATSSSQAVAVGYSYVEGNERDALIRLVTNSGQFLCDRLFNGTNDADDELVDAVTDANGLIYAVGYTKGAGQKSNYLIVKFNPAICDTVWTRQYNYVFNQSDRATAVAVDASGNIYVTGRSDQDLNDTLDNNDAVTLKYSPTGVLQWTQRFNGTTNGRDEATDILIDNAGNVVVCGRTQSGLQDNAFVIKYNPATGTPVWAAPAIYAGSAGLDDRAEAMAVDANDNIFVAGKTVTSVAAGSDDALAFRVTSAGALSGVYTFNGAGSGNDEAAAIATDYQNKVVVLMRSDRDATPLFANYDYVTVKLENNLLTQTWAAPKVYDGPVSDDDEPVALAINSAGEILVTGFSSVDTTGGVTDNNIVSIRYDAWGVQDWISSWQGPAFGDDEPIGLLQQNTATWVCGISDSTVTYQSDAVLLRYDLATAVNEPSVNVSLLSAYPNPASDRVRIRYAQPVSGNDRLCLFDVSGRVVLERPVYFNEFDLDLKGIASGSYRLVISGQGQIQSAGLIVR